MIGVGIVELGAAELTDIGQAAPARMLDKLFFAAANAGGCTMLFINIGRFTPFMAYGHIAASVTATLTASIGSKAGCIMVFIHHALATDTFLSPVRLLIVFPFSVGKLDMLNRDGAGVYRCATLLTLCTVSGIGADHIMCDLVAEGFAAVSAAVPVHIFV